MAHDISDTTNQAATAPRAADLPAGGFALRLLGPPALYGGDERALPGLGPGKSLAMLAYLSVRGPARRDELISLLWGEIPEEKARNAFRQSLHRLRSTLGPNLLPQDREQVALGAPDLVRSDRDDFLAACDAANWDAAVAAYRGEFLEGFEIGEPSFDRWADAERVRLRARFQEALRAAGEHAVADGRLGDALQRAERLVATTPFDEGAAEFHATTLLAAGRQNEALAAARDFAARLRAELDLPTPPGIRALIERLERRARAPGARAARPVPGGRPQAPFVGRSTEIARLMAALSRLRDEQGATLLVEGDAGIGKSRLLDEFAERAKDLGAFTLLRGRELSLSGNVPYAGIATALRPLVRAPGVAGASRHLLAEAARLLPELRDAFDLPEVAPLEDETGRLRFFEGIAAMLDAAAYERPVCLLLDDAQQASPSSLDLLAYLGQRLRRSPVLIVAAFRPDRMASHAVDRLRALAADGDDANARLTLQPLAAAEATSLVGSALAGQTVPPEVVTRIARASEGNPFAALELARRTTAGETSTSLPAALRDILWARLQSAAPSQRRVFFAALLYARPASARLLAAAAHLPEPAAFDAIESLVRNDLLYTSDSGYAIAHDSTATFLVDSSGLAGRALLAGWAADALAAEPQRGDAELASLYAMAGRGVEAFEHARAGAFEAARVGASAEVTRLLGMALTFAPTDAAKREIEALLAAFGPGRLALPAPSDAASSSSPEPSTAEPDEPYEEPAHHARDAAAPSPARAERVDQTHATHWLDRSVRGTVGQWIVGIAISVVVVLAGFGVRRALDRRARIGVYPDTLFLVEHSVRGENTVRAAVNPRRAGRGGPTLAAVAATAPLWADSIVAPWTRALVSPNRQRVALERMTPHGADLFVVSADRRDTIVVGAGTGDHAVLGWSPDSRALLVSETRTLPDGSFDSDLYAAWLGARARLVPIDTSAARAVVEAAWSPAGDHIAWVARTGAEHEREIFVARADGTNAHDITPNTGDNYHPAWSIDGSLLAFTRADSDGTRLYGFDITTGRHWRISDRSGEDHAQFSPDDRSVAFESTRDGDLAVYTRSMTGGPAVRLTPPGREFSIDAWHGSGDYVDRLGIVGPSAVAVGDTVTWSALGVTTAGDPVVSPVRWSILDSGVLHPLDSARLAASGLHVRATDVGSTQIVAAIPGWRADTFAIVVSSARPSAINDDFSGAVLGSRWRPLGTPAPYLGTISGTTTRALIPNGGGGLESGVLLRPSFALASAIHVSATLVARFTSQPTPASLELSLVRAVADADINPGAPQLAPLVSVRWDGASSALVYSVGQQSSSEPIAGLAAGVQHAVEITSTTSGDVVFTVDGRERWRSSLRYLGDVSGVSAQLWIGGRATGSSAGVRNVRVDSSPR